MSRVLFLGKPGIKNVLYFFYAQADLSTEKAEEKKKTRLSGKNKDEGWSEIIKAPEIEGAVASGGLNLVLCSPGKIAYWQKGTSNGLKKRAKNFQAAFWLFWWPKQKTPLPGLV